MGERNRHCKLKKAMQTLKKPPLFKKRKILKKTLLHHLLFLILLQRTLLLVTLMEMGERNRHCKLKKAKQTLKKPPLFKKNGVLLPLLLFLMPLKRPHMATVLPKKRDVQKSKKQELIGMLKNNRLVRKFREPQPTLKNKQNNS